MVNKTLMQFLKLIGPRGFGTLRRDDFSVDAASTATRPLSSKARDCPKAKRIENDSQPLDAAYVIPAFKLVPSKWFSLDLSCEKLYKLQQNCY